MRMIISASLLRPSPNAARLDRRSPAADLDDLSRSALRVRFYTAQLHRSRSAQYLFQVVLTHCSLGSQSSFHHVTQCFLEGARIWHLNRIPSKHHAAGTRCYFICR